MDTKQNLKVYYDGLCILCSSEIKHYQAQPGAEQIDFIDICGINFDAAKENLDPFKIHKVIHARKPDGTVVTRVQAFIEIWERIPKYKFFAKIAKNRFVNQVLEIGYSGFAGIRPWLPKRKADACAASPYCDIKQTKP